MRTAFAPITLAALLFAASGAAETGPVVVQLTLKDHHFTPERVTVPAGRKVRIELKNLDSASEEFDSDDLHVEKDVTPRGAVRFEVGPLKPGRYSFMGELHADTAGGEIEAVATP